MYILQDDNYSLSMVYRLPHYRNLRLQGTQDHTLFKITLTNKRYMIRVKRFLNATLVQANMIIDGRGTAKHFALHIHNNLIINGIKHRIDTGKFIKAFGG